MIDYLARYLSVLSVVLLGLNASPANAQDLPKRDYVTVRSGAAIFLAGIGEDNERRTGFSVTGNYGRNFAEDRLRPYNILESISVEGEFSYARSTFSDASQSMTTTGFRAFEARDSQQLASLFGNVWLNFYSPTTESSGVTFRFGGGLGASADFRRDFLRRQVQDIVTESDIREHGVSPSWQVGAEAGYRFRNGLSLGWGFRWRDFIQVGDQFTFDDPVVLLDVYLRYRY